MLWYNNPDGVKAIRDGRYETMRGGSDSRLMRLVRKDGVSVE